MVLWIELRRRRPWVWAALTSAGWAAIVLVAWGRWWGSWSDASLWSAVPAAYLGGLIAASGADVGHLRLRSGLAPIAGASPRPRWRARAIELLATTIVLAVVPVATVSGGVLALTAPTQDGGRFTLAYIGTAVLYAIGMVGLGRMVSGLSASAVAAPLFAFAFGLLFGIYASPTPPSNPAWLDANPTFAASVAAGALALVVAGELASAGALARHGTSLADRASSPAAGALGTGVLVASILVVPSIPAQITRSPVVSGSCVQITGGSSVCVWPEDARFLDSLSAQAERLAQVSQALPFEPSSWAIREPGLTSPVGDSTVVVRPISLGEGMWFTAQEMAFGLATFPCSGSATQTEAEAADQRVHALATLDATTNFIADRGPPASMIVQGDESQEQADVIVEAVDAMNPRDRLTWLLGGWSEWEAGCR